jgi:hypothetical protein
MIKLNFFIARKVCDKQSFNYFYFILFYFILFLGFW